MDRFLDSNLCDKYNCKLSGLSRIYTISVSTRSYDLEYSSPHCFIAENFLCSDNSWTKVIEKFSKFLLNERSVDLLNFKLAWSKYIPFVSEGGKNRIQISDNVYFYQNNTAQHSVWLLMDLVKYANLDIDKCRLEINKLPRSEPTEIRDFLIRKMENLFKTFLLNLGKNEIIVDKMIYNFSLINKVFQKKMNSGYDNFYLFSNLPSFLNYKTLFIKECKLKQLFAPKNIEKVERYLEYYQLFFKDYLEKYK